jgi:hypothetical protein
MADTIDFEAIRHRVKLLQDTGERRIFENRDGVSCPVCGDAFDEALATTGRTEQLAPDRQLDVCLLRESKRLILFTHA